MTLSRAWCVLLVVAFVLIFGSAIAKSDERCDCPYDETCDGRCPIATEERVDAFQDEAPSRGPILSLVCS